MVLGLISTLITVQKKTGLTLQTDSWVRRLAEDLPQLVWASDECGVKTYCSHSYLNYTGVPDTEAMDRSWTTIIHADDRASTASAWRQSLASGQPYAAEYRLRRSDGVFRFVKAQALPTYDESGRIDGWLGMSKDINEERVAEHAREIEAKLMAVRRLASSISHEINNPLESVTNALFLALQDEEINDKTRDYLRMADTELQRLAHISAHSLRFHKQAKIPTRKQLIYIVEDALLPYRSRVESAEITVRAEYRDDAELLCYADDLSQAIANLVRNSIDATKPGGHLCVRVRKARNWSSEDYPHVRITVADSGEGIPYESKMRLFEPFVTSKGATHTGLALWIADQIVRKHNGKIYVRTSTGGSRCGTLFALVLPVDGLKGI